MGNCQENFQPAHEDVVPVNVGNAYGHVTDGIITTDASGDDTLAFRSSDGTIVVEAEENDPIFGDNLDLRIDPAIPSDIADLQIQMGDAATSIANHSTQIADNAANIATNATNIATNTSELATKAPLASPDFSGLPTAPTPVPSTDNSTRIATTAFVQGIIAANGPFATVADATAATIPVGIDVVEIKSRNTYGDGYDEVYNYYGTSAPTTTGDLNAGYFKSANNRYFQLVARSPYQVSQEVFDLEYFLKKYNDRPTAFLRCCADAFAGSANGRRIIDCKRIMITVTSPLRIRPSGEMINVPSGQYGAIIRNMSITAAQGAYTWQNLDYVFSLGSDTTAGDTRYQLVTFESPYIGMAGISNLVGFHLTGAYHTVVKDLKVRNMGPGCIGAATTEEFNPSGIGHVVGRTATDTSGTEFYRPDIFGEVGVAGTTTVGLHLEAEDTIVDSGWTTGCGIGIRHYGGVNIRGHHFSLGGDANGWRRKAIHILGAAQGCEIKNSELDGCYVHIENSIDPWGKTGDFSRIDISGLKFSAIDTPLAPSGAFGTAGGPFGFVTFVAHQVGSGFSQNTLRYGWGGHNSAAFTTNPANANPFATTIGSPIVTVTDSNSNVKDVFVGQVVNVSGASAVGGITPSGNYSITTIIDTTHYTITHGSNATSTVAAGGGAAVVLGYQDMVNGASMAWLTSGAGTWASGNQKIDLSVPIGARTEKPSFPGPWWHKISDLNELGLWASPKELIAPSPGGTAAATAALVLADPATSTPAPCISPSGGTLTIATDDGTAGVPVKRWEFRLNGTFRPVTNNTYDFGSSTRRIKDFYVAGIIDVNGPQILSGSAAPVITAGTPTGDAPNGSVYLRTAGTATTTLYIKAAAAWTALT